jgi:GNAT superfamily N-acetyltransferase
LRVLPQASFRKAATFDIAELARIDEDAAAIYAEAGISFDGPGTPAFKQAEHERWTIAVQCGLAEVAMDPAGGAIGFMTLSYVDALPYVDQISVVRAWMRKGVGRALLAQAIAWSEQAGELWLTTYAHLPWNAPMYARHGFVIVDDSRCGPELTEVLIEQRAALPCPAQRVAMVRSAR